MFGFNKNSQLRDAVRDNKPSEVRYLLEKGAEANILCPDKDIGLAQYAAQKGYADVLTALLDHGAPLEDTSGEYRRTALMLAARMGHLSCVKILLERGAALNSVDAFHETALLQALEGRHKSVADEFLERDVDVKISNRLGQNALHLAAGRNGYTQICERLLEKGADVNAVDKYSKTALFYALESDVTETALVLLKKEADVKLFDKDGRTALHLAARSGNAQICEQLLEKGVDVNAVDRYGATALFEAVERGHLDVVRVFLQGDVDLDKRDRYGRTALHLAAKSYPSICALLIDKGADMNAVCGSGHTALHNAVWQKCPEVAEELLKRGADVTLRAGENGLTAFEVARREKSYEIVEIFNRYKRGGQDNKTTSPQDAHPENTALYRHEDVIGRGQKLVQIFNFAERVRVSFVETNGMAGAPTETSFDDISGQVKRLQPIWQAYSANGGTVSEDSIYPNGVQKMRLSEIGVTSAKRPS